MAGKGPQLPPRPPGAAPFRDPRSKSVTTPPPKVERPSADQAAQARSTAERQRLSQVARNLPPVYASNSRGEITRGSTFATTPGESIKGAAKFGRLQRSLHRALNPKQWR